MARGVRVRYVGAIGALVLIMFSAGSAEAQTEDAGSSAEAQIVALEAQVQAQDAQLIEQVQEVSVVGGNLQETQAQVDGTVARSQQLSQQANKFQGVLESQQKDFAEAKNQYKEQARAAYKGDNIEGLVGVLDSVLASDEGSGALTRAQVRNVLVRSQQRIEHYRSSHQKLKNIVRQVSQKRYDYQEALKEERAKIQELRRKEEELEASVSQVRNDKAQTDARIQQLREAERQRIQNTRPATGAPVAQRSRELRIARNDIVARPVKPISKKRYRKLYRQSAKKYGFGKDWYILAAVGKVETNHGENMGPSSAGAMGPMQFMPSTWESSGVDGNGDGGRT